MALHFQICSKKLLINNVSMVKVCSISGGLPMKSSKSKYSAPLEHCEKKESFGKGKLPDNVEEIKASQQMQFTPTRARDLSSAHIGIKMNQPGSVFSKGFMGNQSSKSNGNQPYDNHIGKYDCNHTVSLSSVVEGNVPHPFNRSSAPSTYHMGQPAGYNTQTDKYVAGDLQSHHYARQSGRKPDK